MKRRSGRESHGDDERRCIVGTRTGMRAHERGNDYIDGLAHSAA